VDAGLDPGPVAVAAGRLEVTAEGGPDLGRDDVDHTDTSSWSAQVRRGPWSRIGSRLLIAVMVPTVALSALGAVDVAQRYRDANAVSGVVAQVTRVGQNLHLYAGLVAEKNASESIVVASANRISPREASRLVGVDFETQLRSARAEIDAALADGAGTTFWNRTAQLAAQRARIDAGTASESTVRAFFIGVINVAETAWRAQLRQLTQTSFKTVGSAEIRRAIAGLGDTVDAFIAGAKAGTAAGAMSVPGVAGAPTAATDLAAANAVYARATSGLDAELAGAAAAAWQHLIVDDPDVKTFGRFLTALLQPVSGRSAGASLPEIARTFRGALIFQDHLRKVVDAAAAYILPLAHGLRSAAQKDLERYLLALGIITAISSAVALATAHKIVRPLRRLAARASQVSAGVIDGDPLDPSGPYEVASVTNTFNEIVANLTTLDATTLALAAADFDNPVLATSVPGRIGDSLRHSADILHQSIRDNDQLRQSLQRSEIQFRELADGSPDIVWRMSREPQPHFDYLSPSFATLTGIPIAETEGDLGQLVAAVDPAGQAFLADAVAGRSVPDRFDTTLRRADGTLIVFEQHVVQTPGGVQGVGRDVTEIRALEAQLAEQATQDPLTGLANRRLLDELLHRALRRAERSDTPLTVAFLDLDNFKSVNDTYGHDAGDIVLRATAARLQTAVRDADVVARYGGDEFVIVYEGAGDDARPTLAERIADALRDPIDIGDGRSVCCSPCIGIADTRRTANNPTALLVAADHAMLRLKRARHTLEST
jgi:diguanylate cyclase (GGDEF)-like protein